MAAPSSKSVEVILYRPSFDTSLGRVEAGTASCVQLEGVARPVVLTALHLFGPAGGLARDVTPAQLAKIVQSYSLDPIARGPAVAGGAGTAVSLPAQAGDIAAFWCPAGVKLKPLKLGTMPRKGDPLWLAAQVVEGAPANQLLHPATYQGLQEGMLLFTYKNSRLELRATSGAPILNSSGQLVGINYGGGHEQGQLLGLATPVSRFGPPLLKAARSSQPRGR